MSRLHDKALIRFATAYTALFALLEDYPAEKREQTGACGHWSPRQILGHMCGWAQEVRQHFDAFDANTIYPAEYGDIDAVNHQFVEARAHLDWEGTVAELRRLTDPLPRRAADSLRYVNWLNQLARDCENHTGHLRDFIAEAEKPAQTGALYRDYPILEFDDAREAVIEAAKILKPLATMPERCVLIFFREVIEAVCGEGKAEIVAYLKGEMGKIPVYSLEVPAPKIGAPEAVASDAATPEPGEKQRIAVAFPGIGAPFAAATIEELTAYGCKTYVACGGAGVLDKEIAVGHVVVPTTAIRDEGTSYHYLPPGREVAAHVEVVAAIEATLKAHNVPYLTGKTWTTDGIYRETPEKVKRRREEGALTVEMETAAFCAVAQFRGVKLGQLLYGGDDVSSEQWDSRDWYKRKSTREKLFWMAVESVLRV